MINHFQKEVNGEDMHFWIFKFYQKFHENSKNFTSKKRRGRVRILDPFQKIGAQISS